MNDNWFNVDKVMAEEWQRRLWKRTAQLETAHVACSYLRGEVERLEGELEDYQEGRRLTWKYAADPTGIKGHYDLANHPGESWQTTNDSPFPKDCGNAEHEPYITTFDGGWYCSKCSVTWEKTPDVKPGPDISDTVSKSGMSLSTRGSHETNPFNVRPSPDVSQDAYREAGDRWGGIP